MCAFFVSYIHAFGNVMLSVPTWPLNCFITRCGGFANPTQQGTNPAQRVALQKGTNCTLKGHQWHAKRASFALRKMPFCEAVKKVIVRRLAGIHASLSGILRMPLCRHTCCLGRASAPRAGRSSWLSLRCNSRCAGAGSRRPVR